MWSDWPTFVFWYWLWSSSIQQHWSLQLLFIKSCVWLFCADYNFCTQPDAWAVLCSPEVDIGNNLSAKKFPESTTAVMIGGQLPTSTFKGKQAKLSFSDVVSGYRHRAWLHYKTTTLGSRETVSKFACYSGYSYCFSFAGWGKVQHKTRWTALGTTRADGKWDVRLCWQNNSQIDLPEMPRVRIRAPCKRVPTAWMHKVILWKVRTFSILVWIEFLSVGVGRCLLIPCVDKVALGARLSFTYQHNSPTHSNSQNQPMSTLLHHFLCTS